MLDRIAIESVLSTWLDLMMDNFFSFEKRTSYLYFITSLLIAYLVYRRRGKKGYFLKEFFDRKIWLGSSARVDYFIILLNGFVKIIVITPFLFIGIWSQHKVYDCLVYHFGVCNLVFTPWLLVVTYTIVMWIFNDLGTYIIHWLFHRIPFLWEFHKIHHSATTMTPFTLYRIHPVEIIINNFKRLLVYGLVTGLFYYLAKGEVGTITFLGVNIFTFVFMFLGANLRHSHMKMTFPTWLEKIFISPFQHQIHHSDNPKHFNKNLGSHLAIWDYLFDTLVKSKDVDKITFGLGEENQHYDSFWKSILIPFKKLMNW